MAGALAPPRVSLKSTSLVRRLTPTDIDSLRLPTPRSAASMREALSRSPDRSVWIPETLEFALVGMWRNRSDIASVEELVAVRNVEPLLRSAFEQSVGQGSDLLLAIELESHYGRSRYERAGMELLEEVITYEMEISQVRPSLCEANQFLPISEGNAESLSRITRLDNEAFPWLWRNSQQEFEAYIATPGVKVAMLERDGEPIAYIGTTLFSGWGHLDRIAVSPRMQGRGIGQAALTFAIESLRRQGARRIGLSTQGTNRRSQRLYRRFGFIRTPDLDYQLYGHWHRPAMPLTDWDE